MESEDKNKPVSAASGFFKTPAGGMIEIRDVWASNIDEEFENIRAIVDKYPFVAMDTEFPGVVAHPEQYNTADAQYQKMRCNVDLLKLIQLGLTFTDSEGNFVNGCTCWQFNFKFSLSDDLYAEDSIELLKASGIDFPRFEQYGIDIQYFGELMMMSGLVLNSDVKWLTFHSSFDFGYLLKTLTCCELPPDEASFMDLLHTFFPRAYDLKFMMVSVEGLYGGLAALADTLEVQRIGPMHQAGSDSLLTSQTYFKLIHRHFVNNKSFAPVPGPDNNPLYDDSKFVGELFGIGNSIYASASSNQLSNTSTNTKYSISSSNGNAGNSSAMSTIIKKLGQSYSNDSNGYYSSSAHNSSNNLNGGYSSNGYY